MLVGSILRHLPQIGRRRSGPQQGFLLSYQQSLRRKVSYAFRGISSTTKQESAADPKWAETPFAPRVFSALRLSEFSEEELHKVFDRADTNRDHVLDKNELRLVIKTVKGNQLSDEELDELTQQLWEYETAGHTKQEGITEPQFKERTKALAEMLDPRVKAIAAMFAATGTSIGVIMPVMPQLVAQLSITSTEYGLIVGAFAFTKLIANIPAATLVDKYGRKNILTASMLAIGGSLAGIGVAMSFEQIAFCRGLTGIGVAGFLTAATMYISDISTPLNRARSLAPPMTAFSAGAAVGPAIGGVLADSVGIPVTFFTVGTSFGILSLLNHSFMPKSTSLTATSDNTSDDNTDNITGKKKISLRERWGGLLQDTRMFNMTMLNCGYWFVLSGSQITLMPLMLVGDQFQLSASAIGGVFAGASVISVLGTPIAAKMLDSMGQVKAVVPACFVIGAAMTLTPLAQHDIYSFLALFATWTAAGTLLAAGPTAYVSNITSSDDRSQALALLRTGGDVGMLSGAILSGMAAGMLHSQPTAIMINGVGFIVLSGFSGMRLWKSRKDDKNI